MRTTSNQSFPYRSVFTALGATVTVGITVYAIFWFVDFTDLPIPPLPLELMLEPDARQALSGLSEVMVAVLGIALTVVAIIVELASQRYTPRITELFIRDPINGLVMGFFVVTSLLVLWVNMSLYGPEYPEAMVTLIMVLMSLSMATLLPYFAYVFDFLRPVRIIQRLRERSEAAFFKVIRSRSQPTTHLDVARGLEHLGDITLNSIDKNDKGIAIDSLNALKDFAITSIEHKDRLPSAWFDASALAREDQDFVALHPVVIASVTKQGTWVEFKALRQYQAAFNESTLQNTDIAHLIAILTRQIGTSAATSNDEGALRLCVRFINTYLRTAINKRDVRSAYNVFNECRALAEELLKHPLDTVAIEIANHVKFYGQLAFNVSIPFILETAAYDLGALVQRAHQDSAPSHDTLLTILLDVDREPDDSEAQERSLRGVRKAQSKLAAYYLSCDAEAEARRIFEDMRSEKPKRLTSIRRELMSIDEPEYWEVADRGINFDFVEPSQRPYLEQFFGWFAQVV